MALGIGGHRVDPVAHFQVGEVVGHLAVEKGDRVRAGDPQLRSVVPIDEADTGGHRTVFRHRIAVVVDHHVIGGDLGELGVQGAVLIDQRGDGHAGSLEGEGEESSPDLVDPSTGRGAP